ncbi:sulfotransferase family 2 domain-containing protein [Roseovarius sp. EL26]|uniref:sulfotransferase family 2 domain-containing protein n=1 Tax=Roseovarius sp. EL26 TaxID=2126672 RepID=UPI000EA3F795|nr:sulfotransferase family 2 domain-containing protein [Roseovarius sp. EL26]
MLVFSKAKLVFLSAPKTGSTAYQAALAPLAALVVHDPPELKHSPVFRYNRFFRPMLEKFVGEDFEILAVMREPIDWLGSWYRYRQRPDCAGLPSSTQGITFDTFVDAYTRGEQPAYANVGSQSKFLEPQRNGTAVTHLFRYDDQAGLHSFLENRLGTSFTTTAHNVSPAGDLTLSEKTRHKFERKCAADLALWNGIGSNGHYHPLPSRPKP